MKPKYNTSKLRNQIAGASLVTAISICFGGTASATDWSGATSQDWNVNTNWVGGAGTAGSNATINIGSGNYPIISATIAAPPVDIFIANGPGTVGRLDVTAGTAGTGNGNWMWAGRNGGNGTFNVANTSGTGGTYTTFAQGSGSFNVGGRLFIGGENGTGSTGTFNVNTSGTVNIGTFLEVGTNTSVGTVNIDSGTVNAGTAGQDSWIEIGNGVGSNGTFNMSGGTFTKIGNQHLIFGANGATGTANISGGTINSNNETWVGNNGGSNGTLNLSAGTINSVSWVAIGRGAANATGTVNMTGGTWNKTGGGSQFIVGSNGSGTMNMSGGLVDVQNGGYTWVGEANNTTTAILTISGTAEFRSPTIGVGQRTPAAAGPALGAILNLNGGSLRTVRLNGARNQDDTGDQDGIGTVNFNGTQIIASGNNTVNFISTTLDNAVIGAGGLLVNTNGFNLTAPKALTGSGPITKSGLGTLSFTGANSVSGPLSANAGKLAFTTTSAANLTGAVTVANNATFGVRQAVDGEALTLTSVAMGSAGPSAIDIDLGNFPGNTSFAPMNVSGNIALGGTVTINIADALPAVGQIPLIQYGTSSGPGNFVLGTLPLGVAATLDTSNPGFVILNVTSVKLPRWTGAVNGVWDKDPGGTQNWFDLVSATATTYSDNTPALFDDNAPGVTAVTLDISVIPASVTFNNGILTYSLNGTGNIAGSTGLVKSGAGPLTLNTANQYTGVTSLQGGITSVNVLANGGVASSVGQSSSAASNLVLAGGTLNYTGSLTTTNRGFSISGNNSGISTTNDLSISGGVESPAPGSLIKTGAGLVRLINAGTNTIGNTAGQGLKVDGGTFELNGTGGAQTDNISGELWIGSTPASPGNLLLNSATLMTPSWIALGRGNGNSGYLSTIVANNSTISCVNFSTGYDNNLPSLSSQAVTLTNTVWTNPGLTQLAESTNTTTNMVLAGTSTYTTSNRFTMALGTGSVANVTIQDNAGLVKNGGWFSIGNSNNGIGTVTVKNSGTFTADGDLNVSDVGTSQGTLTIQDTAVVNSTGTLWIAKNAGTAATVNLNGGTLNAKQVNGNNSTGVGTFNFNGGILKAIVGLNASFMTGIDNAVIKAGGANIDTNGLTVAINQVISDDATNGSLTKLGTGTLLLNSFNTYLGSTNVTAGTLGGTGLIAGPVSVGAAGAINPGVTTGTLYVDSLSFVAGGKITIDMAATGDTVAVTNALNITNATLAFNGTPTAPVYILASYGSLVGTQFASVPALPAGYSINYDYLGNKQIALIRPITAYETWIDGYFPGVTDPAIVGPKADPDGDGSANIVEFALGGVPNDGSNNPKVYSIIADSSDAGTLNELLMTVAVRTGTPAFSASPSPSATFDGITIVAEGSIDLGTFNSPTAVVTPVTTGIPATPPAGYEYRTFSLTASDGVPNKGFLRVEVNTTP